MNEQQHPRTALSVLRLTLTYGKTRFTLPVAHRLLGHCPGATFLVSYPRSGSTWLRTILSNCLDPSVGGDRHRVNEMIPGVSIRNHLQLRRVQEAEHPLIKSHTRYRPGMDRVLLLVRDGRDVLVSYYHFTTTREGVALPFPIWLRFYHHGLFGVRWHRHVESWLMRGRAQLADNLFLVRFEDLKSDTLGAARAALAFLDMEVPVCRLEQAVESASLKRTQRWERQVEGEPDDKEAAFFRRGAVGGWEEYFDPPLHERFLQQNKRAMKLAGYL